MKCNEWTSTGYCKQQSVVGSKMCAKHTKTAAFNVASLYDRMRKCIIKATEEMEENNVVKDTTLKTLENLMYGWNTTDLINYTSYQWCLELPNTSYISYNGNNGLTLSTRESGELDGKVKDWSGGGWSKKFNNMRSIQRNRIRLIPIQEILIDAIKLDKQLSGDDRDLARVSSDLEYAKTTMENWVDEDWIQEQRADKINRFEKQSSLHEDLVSIKAQRITVLNFTLKAVNPRLEQEVSDYNVGRLIRDRLSNELGLQIKEDE